MCLYDKKRFRISKKPIKVWKVCIKGILEKPYTPFMEKDIHKIMFGGLYGPEHDYYNRKSLYEFGAGFIHAFQTKEKAEEMATIMRIDSALNAIVIEGYIPCFIRYAIGTDGDICSRIMILNL